MEWKHESQMQDSSFIFKRERKRERESEVIATGKKA